MTRSGAVCLEAAGAASPGRPWTAGDWIALAVLLAFFGFLAVAAWKLRRIKKKGLLGHEHRFIGLGGWRLAWPGWWPEPVLGAAGRVAGPLDHDGRLEILTLAEAGVEVSAAGLAGFFERRGWRLDGWDPEEAPGRHGMLHMVEGRGDAGAGERAYFWLALVPGRAPGEGLALLYRASVLYGLADGFFLHEVAIRAEQRA